MPEHPQHHEPDVSSVRPLWIIMMATLGLVLVSSLVVWLVLSSQSEPAPAPRFSETTEKPDWPVLQQKPAEDLEVYKRAMSERMKSSGWVNREEGIVHMPVEQAMKQIVERGLSEVGQ